MMLSLVSAMRRLARQVVDRPHRALAAERVPRRPVAAHALPEGPRPLGVDPRAEAVAAVLQVAPQGVDEGDASSAPSPKWAGDARIIPRSTARSCASLSPSERSLSLLTSGQSALGATGCRSLAWYQPYLARLRHLWKASPLGSASEAR